MPVLVLAGEIYPAFEAQLPEIYTKLYITFSYNYPWYHSSTFTIWTVEEQPDFVAKQLINFLGNSTNGTN